METDTFGADPSQPQQPLALDAEAISITQRLARWLKISGSIQLAFAAMALAILGMSSVCALTVASPGQMLAVVIPLALVATFLLQGLRMQAAGEQFENLANELHADYLELAFGRLRTVFVIELVIASLWLARLLFNLAEVG
jgi:hypothetical protein